MTLLDVLDVILALGLTLRLTRLVISDDIGLWLLRGPAYMWADRHERPVPPTFHQMISAGTLVHRSPTPVSTWRGKLVSGLSCPFCVGFWIGGLVLGSLWLAGGPGEAWEPWRWIAAVFALNYVTAHAGARLGDND